MKLPLSNAGRCFAFLSLCAIIATAPAISQQDGTTALTVEQDHRNMLDQLGIRKLRPGPSGNDNAPNPANYDPAKANPYPDWPELLTLNNGRKVTGDANWLDQQGSYMATVAAGQVWTLLEVKDLGVGNDYRTARMPPVNTDLLDGQLAWRQHDGGHTDAPNIKHFIAWADREMGRGAR